MLTADKILRDMIDVINVIIKGIVMYFLAIMFNFWGYQGGGGNFSPFRCMLIFICAFEIFLTEKFFEKLKQINPYEITPIEALNILYELKKDVDNNK